MRLLYLSDIRFPLERANGIQTMQTCYALAERGHEVKLLVRRDTAAQQRDPFAFYGLKPLEKLQVHYVTGPHGQAIRRGFYVFSALREVTRRSADLVLTRDLGVAAVMLRLPRGVRPPMAYESHGLADVVAASLRTLLSDAASAPASKQRRLLERERRVWTEADGYVTITTSLAQDLEARFGPRDRVAVIPDATRPPADMRPFVFPGPSETPVVAYAGHLYPWKGVETLLTALSQLPDARGLVVGGHPAEPDLARLQSLAGTLGIAPRVTFTGMVPPADVAGYLAAAHVLVLPNAATTISARYTSPLKLFEYLAAGRPVVASDLPALREVLRDDVNALLFTPDDASALARAIARVLSDPALAARLARGALETARQFTWDQRAARFEALFARVVGGAQGRPS